MPQSARANAKPGLRARQQAQRKQQILGAAKSLFTTKGFDETSVAEIAAEVEVSVPTVFNHYGSKVELLLAVILTGHEKVTRRAQKARVTWEGDVYGGVAEILDVISDISDDILSKQAWRHAEATNIQNPGSPFVLAYQEIDLRNAAEIETFLNEALPPRLRNPQTAATMARFIYNAWLQRFIAFIRDEEQSLQSFRTCYRQDVRAFLDLVLT